MVRENWYRDLWLLVLTVMMAVTLSTYQSQRQAAIRVACQDQNLRHDFALKVTNRLLARPPAKSSPPLTPAERAARDAATRTWVSALVPRRDCGRLVKRFAP